jgi:tetratricopeptide (TPR) repeat protein
VDENELRDRLDRLEAGLKALQTRADPAQIAKGGNQIVRASKFLIANWVLLSFVAALCTAAYVKFAFGVDYFRDYRNIQARNNLTAFYTHMGDVLMARGEWLDAAEAYRNAVQIDSGNTAATLGIVKTQIFKPAEGAQYYAPEVADAKLSYLLSVYPDDDQLMFLKGVRLEDVEPDKAIVWYKKAIEKNPGSLGSYINLGVHYMNPAHFNLDEATPNLKRALELDPEFPTLYENLGYIYLVTLDLPQAEKYLSVGYRLSPSWEKACSLADTYRYDGNLDYAIRLRRWALDQLETAKPNDRVLGGSTQWNFMPLKPGDRDTIKETVTTVNLDQKKAFVHYGLSLDYAMKEDFKTADQERETALKADSKHEYTAYFAEVSDSLGKLGQASQATNHWLEQNRIALNKQNP